MSLDNVYVVLCLRPKAAEAFPGIPFSIDITEDNAVITYHTADGDVEFSEEEILES